MELGESPQTGAKREAMEEANLNKPEFSAGEESLEVELFEWKNIPWDDIAFPTVHF